MPRLDRAAYAVLERLPQPVVERLQLIAGGNNAVARRLIRRASGAVRYGAHPIVAGPAKGMLIDVQGSRPSYILGTAEPLSQAFLEEHLDPGDVFYDLGANVGYFSLFAAALVGPSGYVVACEPSPENASTLRANLDRNGLVNGTVVEAAVSDRVGETTFDTSAGNQSGMVSASGDTTVRTTTVDRLVVETSRAPTLVKVDVEGAEDDVVLGMVETLATSRPVVIFEIHVQTPSMEHPVARALAAADYDLRWLEGDVEGTDLWAPHLVGVPR